MFRTAIFTRDDGRKSGGTFTFGEWRQDELDAESDRMMIAVEWEMEGLRLGDWDEVEPRECREGRDVAFGADGKWCRYVEVVSSAQA